LVEDLDFERIVVSRNPASTRARQGHRVLDRLQEVFAGRLHQVDTSEDERTNVERLAELLRAGDVVVPVGGDSTVTQAAGSVALRRDLGKLPLLPLPFGHANQLALMLNSWFQYRRPVQILRRGKTVPIHPLLFSYPERPAEEARLALFTIGIGLTGRAALRFDAPSFRTNRISSVPLLRKVPETVAVARALRETRPFSVDGRRRIEVLIANGPRVAKHGRFGVGLPLQSFALFELADKRPSTLVPVFARFVVQSVQPAEVRSDASLTLSIEPIDGEAIFAQFDGHPFVVEPGEIVITRVADPLYAVTTRRSLYADAEMAGT